MIVGGDTDCSGGTLNRRPKANLSQLPHAQPPPPQQQPQLPRDAPAADAADRKRPEEHPSRVHRDAHDVMNHQRFADIRLRGDAFFQKVSERLVSSQRDREADARLAGCLRALRVDSEFPDDPEDDTSILEEHCSRVFKKTPQT